MRKKKTQPADEPELIAFEDFKPKTLEEAVQRLRDLAEFLVFGKLGHSEFDFSVVNGGGNHGNRCGFIGCAIGELPIRFPQYWWFMPGGMSERTGVPEFVPIGRYWAPKAPAVYLAFDDAATFFGISALAADLLFSRDMDYELGDNYPPFLRKVPKLEFPATPVLRSAIERHAVAANLISFAYEASHLSDLDALEQFLNDVELMREDDE